jgi:hypothetical protein
VVADTKHVSKHIAQRSKEVGLERQSGSNRQTVKPPFWGTEAYTVSKPLKSVYLVVLVYK